MEEGLNEDDFKKGSNHDDQTQKNNPAKAQAKATIDATNSCDSFETSTSFHKSTTDRSTTNNENRTPKFEPRPSRLRDDAPLFLAPTPKSAKLNMSIIKQEPVYELDSSDEEDVVEVALPPKPTITIESSDEDDVQIVDGHSHTTGLTKSTPGSRSPSIVSSMSDEFMRNDCIALNISSHQESPRFDFSLHGSDLLDQNTPPKKKKNNKEKESPIAIENANIRATPARPTPFAMPKSKSKKKRKSDNAEHGQTDLAKRKYTAFSVPSADVYESDSNQSTIEQRDVTPDPVIERVIVESVQPVKDAQRANQLMIDLTKEPYPKEVVEEPIENIVMANVSGIVNEPAHKGAPCEPNARYGSTRVPAILFEDLDFDNLKGTTTVSKKHYSLRTLRVEMEKFYNESWGGENFNHTEIQKYMSRDKSLWAIDPKDRHPNAARRKIMCYQCNRPGHRDEQCRMRPVVCYMCGRSGHHEQRCPTKICVNCGASNFVYSAVCRNCTDWGRITCPECGQHGHPYTHCPDLWRRYHNTTENATPLVENHDVKRNYHQFCSGCARRGHLVHTCRNVYPFSGLPVNNPYVSLYRPVYTGNQLLNNNLNSKPTLPKQTEAPTQRPIKRRSISPIHPNHEYKQKCLTVSHSKQTEDSTASTERTTVADTEEPAEADKVTSSNHDKKGHMIQDNQVSDTSDIVTTARVYLMKDVLDNLKQAEGVQWIRDVTTRHKVTVTHSDGNSYLSVTGNVGDQVAFQNELKAWVQAKSPQEETTLADDMDKSFNIPKNRNNVLKKLDQAFISLEADIGDPKMLFKELTYLQKNHKLLLKQRIVNPVQLTHNRNNINEMQRKLNMVLLGQAGLADGSAHLHKLHELQEQLVACRRKNLTKSLRQQIGQHYHTIFAAAPRDDYDHLLKMYYEKTPDDGDVQQKRFLVKGIRKSVPIPMTPLTHRVKAIIKDLSHIHKRVVRTQPSNFVLKKTRRYLLNMLNNKIIVLSKLNQVSHKTMKKLAKLQEQSHSFLSNV